MKKTITIIICLVILGLVGWEVYEKVASRAGGSGGPRGNVGVAVKTEEVRRATIRDVGLFTGSLHARS